LQTVDPLEYATEDLQELEMKEVVYRSVAKQGEAEMLAWMRRAEALRLATVFVGAPSRDATLRLHLSDAYRLRWEHCPGLALGGVAIAERHRTRGEEDARVASKQSAGCSFFVSQAVYDVTAAKEMVHRVAQIMGRSWRLRSRLAPGDLSQDEEVFTADQGHAG
jgi:hypothetical protein